MLAFTHDVHCTEPGIASCCHVVYCACAIMLYTQLCMLFMPSKNAYTMSMLQYGLGISLIISFDYPSFNKLIIFDRQTYMDYSICKAASFNSDGLNELLIIYDIGC